MAIVSSTIWQTRISIFCLFRASRTFETFFRLPLVCESQSARVATVQENLFHRRINAFSLLCVCRPNRECPATTALIYLWRRLLLSCASGHKSFIFLFCSLILASGVCFHKLSCLPTLVCLPFFLLFLLCLSTLYGQFCYKFVSICTKMSNGVDLWYIQRWSLFGVYSEMETGALPGRNAFTAFPSFRQASRLCKAH